MNDSHQMVCQVSDLADLPSGPAAPLEVPRRRPPTRCEIQPSDQPWLLSNGRPRKSRTYGKTIYKGCNLGAPVFRCIPYGFFQLTES
jgi:hypothetical protein